MSDRKPLANGKRMLRPSGRPLKTRAGATGKFQQVLAAVYDDLQKLAKPRKNARCRRNFVFHMTDWLEDLHDLNELAEHPDRVSRKQATRLVSGFIYHVLPHLRAAGRLLDYSPEDIFRELDYQAG